MKTLMKTTAACGFLLGLSCGADAQSMPDPAQLQQAIAQIRSRYETRFEALRADGEAVQKDLPSKEETLTGISVGKLMRYDWYVRIPEFTLKQQTWYVRIPEFVMREQRWRFHVPKLCTQYYSFVWGGGMHLPGVCMEEKQWFVRLPEVAMREQKWILGVPEVTMKDHHWIFHAPEIKVESSQKRIDAAKTKGEEISQRGQMLADEMSAEIKLVSRDYLTKARVAVNAQFEPALTMFRAALNNAPEQAKADLQAKLNEVEKARNETLKGIDDQLAVGT